MFDLMPFVCLFETSGKRYTVWIKERISSARNKQSIRDMHVVDTKTSADKPYPLVCATSDCRCAAGRFLVDDQSQPNDDRDCLKPTSP